MSINKHGMGENYGKLGISRGDKDNIDSDEPRRGDDQGLCHLIKIGCDIARDTDNQ